MYLVAADIAVVPPVKGGGTAMGVTMPALCELPTGSAKWGRSGRCSESTLHPKAPPALQSCRSCMRSSQAFGRSVASMLCFILASR